MEIEKLREKHSDKIPVVCFDRTNTIKFLVPEHITLSQFIFFYRKRIRLESNSVIYVQVLGRNLVNFNEILSDLYTLYHSDDQCLYLYISNESYMGNFS